MTTDIMLKLFLSPILFLTVVFSTAQQKEPHKFFASGGVNALVIVSNPVNFRTAVNYSLQLGATHFPVRLMLKAGFPEYNPHLTTYLDYEYFVKGNYWQPGLVVYIKDIEKDERVGFYLGVSRYLGEYNHNLKITMSDQTWNTSRTYTFEGSSKVRGFVGEMTTLIGLYKRLTCSMSVHAGAAKIHNNPFPSVQSFEESIRFIPGLGKIASGDKTFLNVTIGIHYIWY